MNQRNKEVKIEINQNSLKNLRYILQSSRVPLIRNYLKIEELLEKRINSIIDEDEYKKGYNKIVNDCKEKLSIFKNKVVELYLINEINKNIKKESITLYNSITIDIILNCLVESLKIGLFPVNVFNYIIEFDDSKLLDSLGDSKFEISIPEEISIQEKMLIKNSRNIINNRNKINKNSFVKLKKM